MATNTVYANKVIEAKAKDILSTKINLLIGDISAKPLPGLPMNAVASLFSNAKANDSRRRFLLPCSVPQP